MNPLLGAAGPGPAAGPPRQPRLRRRAAKRNGGDSMGVLFGIPFWLVGGFTLHFRLPVLVVGFVGVHWGIDLAFDPWPQVSFLVLA